MFYLLMNSIIPMTLDTSLSSHNQSHHANMHSTEMPHENMDDDDKSIVTSICLSNKQDNSTLSRVLLSVDYDISSHTNHVVHLALVPHDGTFRSTCGQRPGTLFSHFHKGVL